eukprot:3941747-Rhodomonas_salina.3
MARRVDGMLLKEGKGLRRLALREKSRGRHGDRGGREGGGGVDGHWHASTQAHTGTRAEGEERGTRKEEREVLTEGRDQAAS